MKKIMVLFAIVMSFSSVSHAALLIEPYLGYEIGKIKNDDAKLNGTQLGARFGYHSPVMFWAALDYTMGMSAKWEMDSGASSDAKRSTLYGVVGLDFPILLRGWVGVSLMDEMKLDNDKLKGNATKVGFGFTGLPFVSLNFEYLTEKFTDANGATIDPTTENSAYMLSVSMPLEF